MNKRLLLALYDRSGLGAYMPVDYNGHELEVAEHMEKFAELIVKECAESLWTEECYNSDLALEEFEKNSKKIKEHFGVEE